jgi:hypothetical protein
MYLKCAALIVFFLLQVVHTKPGARSNLKKKVIMRRWFCCTHADTPYQEDENEFMNSPDRTSGMSVS